MFCTRNLKQVGMRLISLGISPVMESLMLFHVQFWGCTVNSHGELHI